MVKTEWELNKFTFVQVIPKKYGACKGFFKIKNRLYLACEHAILRLKEKK